MKNILVMLIGFLLIIAAAAGVFIIKGSLIIKFLPVLLILIVVFGYVIFRKGKTIE